MGRLDGRTAIITGAASGIGRAASKMFAAEGARLVCVDKSEKVEETAAMVVEAGGKAVALTGDVAEEAFVEAYVARALSEYGGLDACWANAGIAQAPNQAPTIHEMTVESWETVLRVNLIGVFLAAKHASKPMIEQGRGSLIFTASVAGIRSGAGSLPYSASKAGVMNFAATLANDFYGTGVRVNAVCPGLIETGMTKGMYDYARSRGSEGKIGQLNPLTRGGEPHEIAAMGLFLASDDASYVNGQAIAVDGGLSSSHPVARRGKR